MNNLSVKRYELTMKYNNNLYALQQKGLQLFWVKTENDIVEQYKKYSLMFASLPRKTHPDHEKPLNETYKRGK